MNKCIFIGNLTRDPELTTTPSGVSVCQFAIAVNRDYKDDDGNRVTDFINITAWRGLAEIVSKYLKKGNKVAVVGQLQIRNYEDKQGQKRTAVNVIAQSLEFLSSANNTQANGSNGDGKKSNLTPAEWDDADIPF